MFLGSSFYIFGYLLEQKYGNLTIFIIFFQFWIYLFGKISKVKILLQSIKYIAQCYFFLLNIYFAIFGNY